MQFSASGNAKDEPEELPKIVLRLMLVMNGFWVTSKSLQTLVICEASNSSNSGIDTFSELVGANSHQLFLVSLRSIAITSVFLVSPFIAEFTSHCPLPNFFSLFCNIMT
jgi:hypothetical protein